MAGKEVVETIYGKRHKFEVVKVKGWSTKFAIHRDGSRWKGDYDSLARAVDPHFPSNLMFSHLRLPVTCYISAC